MRHISALLFALFVLTGCQYSTPDRILHDSDEPFGSRTVKPFDDMIANAHQPESTLGEVPFDFDRAELTLQAKSLLDQIAKEVDTRTGRVIIEGHADHFNSEEYNLRLGYRRALAVAEYLKSAGVWDERMVIHSFGENRPDASNWTDAGRGVNRRVVVKMLAQGDGMTGKEAVKVKRSQLSGGEKSGGKQQTVFSQMMSEMMKPAPEASPDSQKQ